MIDGRALAEVEGWGPAFPVGEYGDRVEKVRREMARREIDVLLVSSPPNITYLTGYDMIWYYLTSPVSVAVHARFRADRFLRGSLPPADRRVARRGRRCRVLRRWAISRRAYSQISRGAGLAEGQRGCRGVEPGAERGRNQRDKAGLL